MTGGTHTPGLLRFASKSVTAGYRVRGARADLMLVDYYPPTPLIATNLFGHILWGIAHAPVDSLMVNGRFIVRDHRCVTVDERTISERARARARKLWERL
jgi:hypothetical protein